MERWVFAARGCVVLALLATCFARTTARSEYAPDMEPGRLAVRHAAWAAAEECRPTWPASGPSSVVMHATLNRRGRVLAVRTEPDARAFARCVRRSLRAQTFSVTGPDASTPRWEVVSRFVFPALAPP